MFQLKIKHILSHTFGLSEFDSVGAVGLSLPYTILQWGEL